MTFALVLKYWREIGIGLAAVLLFAACESRDNALKRAGAAEALTKTVRDSNRSNAKQIRVVDTLVRHDTVVQRRLIARTDTLRDSVLLHLTDTVRVREFVVATDSLKRACSETTNDCARFRQLAEVRFNNYETEIAALKQGPKRQHFGLGCTAGGGPVYELHDRRLVVGPGGVCGFTYRW